MSGPGRAHLHWSALFCLAMLAPWVASCGGDAPRASDDPAVRSAAGAEPADRGSDATSGGATVGQPVDSDALVPFLPEMFAGMTRDGPIRPLDQVYQGDPSNGAEAEYRGASGGVLAPVTITIWDHGASEYWTRTYGLIAYETEERSGNELNRHTKFRGHPTAEREARNGDNVESGMEIWVAGRYLVDIQSWGLTLAELREGARTLDLESLAALDQ